MVASLWGKVEGTEDFSGLVSLIKMKVYLFNELVLEQGLVISEKVKLNLYLHS